MGARVPSARALAPGNQTSRRFPLTRLKNTSDELRHQDQRLRQTFTECCRRFGLVVAGYSGRDDSIMSTLEEALESERPFASGLFCQRGRSLQSMGQLRQERFRASGQSLQGAMRPLSLFNVRLLAVRDPKARL